MSSPQGDNLAHTGVVTDVTRIPASCYNAPGGLLDIHARPVRRGRLLVDLPSAVVTTGVAAVLIPVGAVRGAAGNS